MRVFTTATRVRLFRVALIAYCLAANDASLRALTPPKPPPVVTAPIYRAELERTLKALRRWQKTTPPNLKDLRGAFPSEDTRAVQRGDSTKQNATGNDWARRLDSIEYSRNTQRVSRRDLRALEAIVQNRLREFDAWSKSAYRAPDAQSIIKNLDDSGTISTAPPTWQLWWQNAKDAVSGFLQRLFSWKPSPGNVPNIKGNPTWINFFFASTLAALLIVIAWWLWRTFGGRWTRGGARREVRFSESEEELLLLPPDELRVRAEKLASQGDYAQALRHRYVAILLTLDGHGVWRYDTRRTNWEHIAALRKKRETKALVAPLSSLTFRFDGVRYGEMTCTQPAWTQFSSDAKALETMASSTRDSAEQSVANAMEVTP